jgi:uncharacterized membrane protein
VVKKYLGVFTGFTVLYAISRIPEWQNSILEVMNQKPIEGSDPFLIMFLAIIIAFFSIGLGRLVRRGFSFMMNKIYQYIPRRISLFIGFLGALCIFIFLLNGFFGGFILGIVDSASAQVDAMTDDGAMQPTEPNKTGSSESLIAWNTLGRAGRNFISKGPTKEEISAFSGTEALDPIRVYIGLNAAPTKEEGATLALEELKRVGAFDRSILIITTPTGTGWMDPYAADTIEYIHAGDTAIAAMQYSYLQSPIALLVGPEKPREAAQAMFDKIYGHWITLPKNNRPKIYLNGVSLGTFGSESSFKLYEVIGDPINGALWAGPPFANWLWPIVTKERNEGTPMWLPTYRDSSFVRFKGQDNSLNMPNSTWGPMRIVYLQYASDPISFFAPNTLFKKPEWLEGQRGPDVSPLLRWYPGITFFQLLFDLMVSVSGAPLGHGHNYSPIHYIDGWVAITDPPQWNEEKTTQLKKLFSE